MSEQWLTRVLAYSQSWTFVLDDIVKITRELPLWTHMFGPWPVFYHEATLGLRLKKDRYRTDPGRLRRLQDLQLSQQQQSQVNGPRRSSRVGRKPAKYDGCVGRSRMGREGEA